MNLYEKIVKESEIKELKENFGDTEDYSSKILSLFKRWWKENADLGIRIFKGIPSIDTKYTNDEFHKPLEYYITLNTFWVDVEDYADEIGKYVADSIPSIEFKGFVHNTNKKSEDYEDIVWTFTQNQDIPNFESEKEEI